MYYIVYGLLYLISLLPLRVLYLISDFFYFIIYYILGYRKKVVMNNLSIAFPEKTEAERIRIAKKFYLNLTDTFIETIKLISAGSKFISRHFRADYTIFHDINKRGKKCQVHLGHNFNWELANVGVPYNVKQDFLVVYMPMGSKIFDRIFKKIRTRTGCHLLPATNMRTAMIPWRNKQYILALVADQNPAWPSNAYWVNFFGRPTPFLKGPENGSKSPDVEVVFGYFFKRKRGYYEGRFILADENSSSLPKGELTKRYAHYLEAVIREYPDMWLWSHRRWKFEWKPEYGEIM